MLFELKRGLPDMKRSFGSDLPEHCEHPPGGCVKHTELGCRLSVLRHAGSAILRTSTDRESAYRLRVRDGIEIELFYFLFRHVNSPNHMYKGCPLPVNTRFVSFR